MLRRKRSDIYEAAVDATKGLDAFPKIDEDYKETSSTRGTYTMAVLLVISLLVFFEVKFFLKDNLRYSYDVDNDFTSKLKLKVDITVASNCKRIAADVFDGTNMFKHQTLEIKDTWFEMSPRQQIHFNNISEKYEKIRSNYHALHSALWHSRDEIKIIEREVEPNYPKDACRINGTLEIEKVVGMFHILGGKMLNIMGQHAHIINKGKSNFSHRVDNFSFGDNTELVHNALNNELKIDKTSRTIYQYYISVVVTEVSGKSTFQYSVTERQRSVDEKNRGIYLKYDISPIKVKVALDKKPYHELIVPLIGIIGGIFATSTMLNSLYQSFSEYARAK